MHVYRWEDDDGLGPYTGGAMCDVDAWLRVPHSPEEGRPAPQWDGLDEQDVDGTYGFASLEQERQWFRPHERWAMLCNGFRLIRCETQAHVAIGFHQCVMHGVYMNVGWDCPFRKV